ncbi:hypothetical protein ABIF91_003972 [Bradyrhizobium sp. USDA 241]
MAQLFQKRNTQSFLLSVRRWITDRHEGFIVAGLIVLVLVLVVFSVPR